MYFYPIEKDAFFTVLEAVRAKAVAEATKIATAKGIKMRVDRTKPVDFGLTDYKIPTATQTYTLKENTAFFPAGIFNNDDSFDYIRWWSGAGVIWIGEWFVRDIYYMTQKQGVYAGNLEHYEFRGPETFRFSAHSTTGAASVDAWFIAFTVRPESMAEVRIIQ
ncbi:MAG: hypothetical protein QXW83_04450 [Nitrososphaerales archaeon]